MVGTKVRLISEGVSRPSIASALRDEAADGIQRERPGPRHDRLLFVPASRQDGAIGARGREHRIGDSGRPHTRGSAERRADLRHLVRASHYPARRGGRARSTAARTRAWATRRREPNRAACCGSAGATPSARCALTPGCMFGITSNDPSVGFTAGFTYVFDAFQVP